MLHDLCPDTTFEGNAAAKPSCPPGCNDKTIRLESTCVCPSKEQDRERELSICGDCCKTEFTMNGWVCDCSDAVKGRRLSICGDDCKAEFTLNGWMCDCSDAEESVTRKLSSHNDACCNSITKTCCN